MPKAASRTRANSRVAVKKSVAKKGLVKKSASAKTPSRDSILEAVHTLPGPSHTYLWCDYIELRCLVHPDKRFSRQDLIEAIDDSQAAGISPAEGGSAATDDGQFEVSEEGSEADDDEEHEEDDVSDVLPSSDRSEARSSDLFSNLELRSRVFEEAYPFEVIESGHLLKLKTGPLTAGQYLYLQLLLSASLKFVPKRRRKELTDPFEFLSYEIFKGLMPAGWEVYQFGAASVTRYRGHLSARMDKLAQDWRGQHMLSRSQYPANNSGDGGLDLVAWHPLGSDERVGIPLAAAQCGCTANEWRFKPLEASPAALRPKLHVQYPWTTYYFMPQDLLAIENEKYDWQRRDWLVECIVLDRLRIVRLANQFGVTERYAAPSPAVSEAKALAIV